MRETVSRSFAGACRRPGGSGKGSRPEDPGADGLEKFVPSVEIGDDADIVFHPDLVDRGDLLLLRPLLEMNGVFNDDGKSEILREPFQGRPFLLGPLDGGAQSKF